MTDTDGLETLMADLRQKIVATVGLAGLSGDDLPADGPLFGPTTGLDSIDVLELVVMVEKEYGVTIKGKEVGEQAFETLRSLATFIQTKRAEG
ncbi:MAG: hypothetical protein JW751_04550 [Polyangiaceae bacterium]|nr:hypothetical protein [Polyangiaceae bacterium]